MKGKVSIIIPVYNLEEYIRAAIESVITQSYENWEAIIVDDGSRDKSPLIIDEYAQLDKRITAIHQPNGGVTSARRNALTHATGDFILFLDADDALPQDSLSTFVAESKDDIDIIVAPRLMVNGEQSYIAKPIVHGLFSAYEFAYFMSNSFFPPGIGSKMYRKTLFDDETLHLSREIRNNEDLIMNLRLSRKARRTKILNKKPLYICNVRMNSASRTKLPIESWHKFFSVLSSESEGCFEKAGCICAINALLYRFKGGELSHGMVMELLHYAKWKGSSPVHIYVKYLYLKHPNSITDVLWKMFFIINRSLTKMFF